MIETAAPGQSAALEEVPAYLDVRKRFAAAYLRGDGLEIGALHQPLGLPSGARARYVDRMDVAELREQYPELAAQEMAAVDLVEDGETLPSIPASSQDFIIANHFLEHAENPIGTIETHLGKLRPGGVLFYALPDKRFSFDFRRPVTPVEHLFADYEQGPERSRAEHFEEWCRLVVDADGAHREDERPRPEDEVLRQARELEAREYSIHMHVWTQDEFLRLLLAMREHFDGAFDLEAMARTGLEFVVVLRKRGPLPEAVVTKTARLRSWASPVKRRLLWLRDLALRRRARP
jgi:SAM-dependent methyltransferase